MCVRSNSWRKMLSGDPTPLFPLHWCLRCEKNGHTPVKVNRWIPPGCRMIPALRCRREISSTIKEDTDQDIMRLGIFVLYLFQEVFGNSRYLACLHTWIDLEIRWFMIIIPKEIFFSKKCWPRIWRGDERRWSGLGRSDKTPQRGKN